jgi:transposase
MAKKIGLLSPTQLWGKPLKPAAPQKAKEEKVTGKMTYEDDVTDDEIDVDAELADADVEDDETLQVVAAEDDSDVADEVADGEPEEDAEDDEPDYDAEDGDVSDSSEDVVEADEEVVTAVADDEETGEKISATTRESSMAEKMSLSDHVRAEIDRRHKADESLRGKDIVDALAKKKIKVSPAQVSQLLKKAGLGGQPRSKKAAAPAAVGAGEKSRAAHKGVKKNVEPVMTAKPKSPVQFAAKRPAATNGFKVPMEQLQAAEAFVESCGGSFQAAERILTAAAQLSQTFGG